MLRQRRDAAPPRLYKFMWGLAGALLVWLACAPPALAHTGLPPAPADLWTAWNWSLTLWVGLGLTAWVYARGWRVLELHRQRPAAWQTACLAAGLGLTGVALISPLDAASSALFSVHMVQHVLLILAVAPMLVLSQPLGALLLGLPKPLAQWLGHTWRGAGWLRWAWEALGHPVAAGGLMSAALWGWHIPAAYQAALGNQWIHDLEHFSFLGTALLFWWWVLRPASHQGANVAASFLAIFVTGLQSTVLALLLTTSPWAWYPAYAASTPAWGLTPLQDQQVAGAIMWIPSTIVYLCAVAGVLAAWINEMDARDRRQHPEWAAWNGGK